MNSRTMNSVPTIISPIMACAAVYGLWNRDVWMKILKDRVFSFDLLART